MDYFRPARPYKPYASHTDVAKRRAYVVVPAGAVGFADSGGGPPNCRKYGSTVYWTNASCHNGTQSEAGRTCSDAKTQWLRKWGCGGTASPPPTTSAYPCKGLTGQTAINCCVRQRGNCKVGQHWSLNSLGGCTCALNATSTPPPATTGGGPCKGTTGQAALNCCNSKYGTARAGTRWSLNAGGYCNNVPVTSGGGGAVSGVFSPQTYGSDSTPCKYTRLASGVAAARYQAVPYGGTNVAQKVVTYTRSSNSFNNDVTLRCKDARDQWCALYGKDCGGIKKCFVGGVDPCTGATTGTPSGGGGIDTTDADCDAWGGAKGICTAGKSFIKGIQASLGGVGDFGANISGANLYPIILIGIGVFAVVFLLKGK